MKQGVNTQHQFTAGDFQEHLITQLMKVRKLQRQTQEGLNQDPEEATHGFQIASMTRIAKHSPHHSHVGFHHVYGYPIAGIVKNLTGDSRVMNVGSRQPKALLGLLIQQGPTHRLHRLRVSFQMVSLGNVLILQVIWQVQSFKAKSRSQSAPKQRPEAGQGPRKKPSLHDMMESRSSLSGVKMQRSCSQVQDVVTFKNAIMGKLDKSADFVKAPGRDCYM